MRTKCTAGTELSCRQASPRSPTVRVKHGVLKGRIPLTIAAARAWGDEGSRLSVVFLAADQVHLTLVAWAAQYAEESGPEDEGQDDDGNDRALAKVLLVGERSAGRSSRRWCPISHICEQDGCKKG
eukprot:6077567-Pleurochrysis_carterae.AAC.2